MKNPWRSGSEDKEEEKLNEEINEIVDSFKDIKLINDKYKDTGEEIVLNDGNTYIQIQPENKSLVIKGNE